MKSESSGSSAERDIAGDDLRDIMIERQEGRPLPAQTSSVAKISDLAEAVGDHRGLQTVLTQVFRAAVSHKCPALDIPHPGQGRKEMTVHLPNSSL